MKRMKKLLSGIALIPLIAGLVATGCEVEVGKDDSKVATWVGWPADGRRDESTTGILKFTFTEPVETLTRGDFEITEELASGFFEIDSSINGGEPYKGDVEGKIWYLPVTPDEVVGEGLARVTINNSKVEKTQHGVPVFIEADRAGYSVHRYPDSGNTTHIYLRFEDGYTYSERIGDELFPSFENVTLEGDAYITGKLAKVDDEYWSLPIKVTKQGGSATVFIEQAGIARTNGIEYIRAGIVVRPYIGDELLKGDVPASPYQTHTVTGLVKPKTSWTARVIPTDTTAASSEIELTFPTPVEIPSGIESNITFSPGNDKVQVNGHITSVEGGYKWIIPISPVAGITWGTTPGETIKLSIPSNSEITDGLSGELIVKGGSTIWGVSADGFENAKTTETLTLTFSSPIVVAESNITITGATRGAIGNSASTTGIITVAVSGGSVLGSSTSAKGNITVGITGVTNLIPASVSVEVYKYVSPPPPAPPSTPPSASTPAPTPSPPPSTDPFDGNRFPIAINEAGKNLQIEVYQNNYANTSKGGYPYGDTTAKQVIEHRDYYEVEIAPAGTADNGTWTKITTKPQVSNSGKLGPYDNAFWPITPTARKGMGKIQVRIRARKTDNLQDVRNMGAWVTFTNGGKGW